jgi:DNA-binding transcriptional LysR family regulator
VGRLFEGPVFRGWDMVMPMSADRLSEMRLGDLVTFLAVRRSGSITGAARELKVTPSQVSKAVARLEALLQLRLLSRSSRGVALSEAGLRVVPHVEAAVARLRLIGRARAQAPELTVAAPSYLIQSFLPTIALAQPDVRVRGLELPPALLRAYAAENFFDLALVSDIERLPSTWVSVNIGDLRKTLFGPPVLAKRLGQQPVHVDKLRGVAFVVPIYNADGRFVAIDDDCPLAISERVIGHEAQTIGLALELSARTEQLVFGPALAAHRHLATGRLVEIRVRGWDLRDPLYVACNADRVLSRVQNGIVKALRAALAEIDER